MFTRYIAIGTSISAGIQSGGIDDSTQKQAFPYLLATAMGLTPEANWYYPKYNDPGCPPPFTDPLTNSRVANGTAATCGLLDQLDVPPQGFFNNLGVPSIRVAQVLNIDTIPYAATDTLFLQQFITGGRRPLDIVLRAQPSFVTLEIGANDVLGAATHGSTALLTPIAAFEAQFTAIADSIDLTHAKVAVANIPNVTVIPHFSAGVIFWCLHNGGPFCPAAAGFPPATLPYSSPNFVVDSSCIATALYPSKGVGDSMLVAFTATANITGTLSAGGAATLNCGAGTATVNQGAGFVPAGPVLTKASTIAIAGEVLTLDAFIAQQANTRGWALVDLNGLLAANKAQIPPFPLFSAGPPPSVSFGPLFSLDGIHPTAAGHKAIADAFVAAINAKFGTSLTAP